jgi:hypothetical protein
MGERREEDKRGERREEGLTVKIMYASCDI